MGVWPKFGLNLASIWPRFGLNLALIWAQFGLKLASGLARIWPRFGLSLAPIWPQNGQKGQIEAKLRPKRGQNEAKTRPNRGQISAVVGAVQPPCPGCPVGVAPEKLGHSTSSPRTAGRKNGQIASTYAPCISSEADTSFWVCFVSRPLNLQRWSCQKGGGSESSATAWGLRRSKTL